MCVRFRQHKTAKEFYFLVKSNAKIQIRVIDLNLPDKYIFRFYLCEASISLLEFIALVWLVSTVSLAPVKIDKIIR